MEKKRCNGKSSSKRVKFTPYDDSRLFYYVSKLGTHKWFEVSLCMKNKTSRQCRDRWKTYLSPEISHEDWTEEDDKLLYEKYLENGSKWSLTAKYFPNRTNNAIKNRCMVLIRRQKRINKNVPSQPSSPETNTSHDSNDNIVLSQKDTKQEANDFSFADSLFYFENPCLFDE